MSDETSPFSSLPGPCIAKIIARTSPEDACRLAAVSVRFKSVADSDSVWQRFVPEECLDFIPRATPPLSFKTMKQLYFLLINKPLLLDGGRSTLSVTSGGGWCFFWNI